MNDVSLELQVNCMCVVSGISAANRVIFFVHTEYVDNFVGLSQQESVVPDAGTSFWRTGQKAGLPVHPVTCSPGRETLGWEFDPLRPVVGVCVLHCFMSHHWGGRARTKPAVWLVTSHFGLHCGGSSWLLSVRLTLPLNAAAVRDGAYGYQ